MKESLKKDAIEFSNHTLEEKLAFFNDHLVKNTENIKEDKEIKEFRGLYEEKILSSVKHSLDPLWKKIIGIISHEDEEKKFE